MIATDAALYDRPGSTSSGSGHPTGRSTGVSTPRTCGCGQEIGGLSREHCPRCGCCLN